MSLDDVGEPIIPTQEFLTLSYVREQLGIDDSDTMHDGTMQRHIVSANRTVSLILVTVLDQREMEGSQFVADARSLAWLYFMKLFTLHQNHNPDESKNYQEQFEESKEILVAAIKAQPKRSTRTVLAHASAGSDSYLLRNIHSMTDRYGRLLDDGRGF